MNNQNLLFTVNDVMVNAVVAKYYEANAAKFASSSAFEGQPFSYAAASAPALTLSSNAVSVAFSTVNVTISNQEPVSLQASFGGTVAVTSGVLSLTLSSVTIQGAGAFLDTALGKTVKAAIQKQYMAAVEALPIPVFQNVLDSKFSLAIQSATVQTGMILINVGLSYEGIDPVSSAAPPTASLSIPMPFAGFGVNLYGIETALQSQASDFPMSQDVNQSSSTAGFGYGVKGTVQVGFPSVNIQDGVATATVDVGFGLSVGVETAFVWTWTAAPIPPARVTVSLGLVPVLTSASIFPTQVAVQISSVQSIAYSDRLSGLGGNLESLIESAVSSKIHSALVGKQFPLFNLPSSVPGASIAASFMIIGLAFVGSGATLLVVATSMGS